MNETIDDELQGDGLPPLPSEQLAMAHLAKMADENVAECLVMSPGRGQSAWIMAELHPNANVTSWFVDAHRAARAEAESLAANARCRVLCSADLPETKLDLAVLPVLKTGEAEMNRELLQQAYQRLKLGGQLVASVNAAKDHWLQKQMQELFPKVRCLSDPQGWVYVGKKQGELKKERSFEATIDFRVDDRVLKTFSRPSVFSHRSIDTAARVMIREVPVPTGSNVLELGCGNGGVALAAAIRSKTGAVYAVDSNARAVECVRQAAEFNGIENLTAILNHDGQLGDLRLCDLALLNPPYYGDFAIAEHFVNTSIKHVRSGGEIWVITKQAEKYHDCRWTGTLYQSSSLAQGYDLICYRKQ